MSKQSSSVKYINFRINFFYLEKAENSLCLYKGIKEKNKNNHIRRTKATESPCDWLKRISTECYLLQRGLCNLLDTVGVKPENTSSALNSLNGPIK